MLGCEGVKTIQICKYCTHGILWSKTHQEWNLPNSQSLWILFESKIIILILKKPPAPQWLASPPACPPYQSYEREYPSQIFLEKKIFFCWIASVKVFKIILHILHKTNKISLHVLTCSFLLVLSWIWRLVVQPEKIWSQVQGRKRPGLT